MIKRLTIGLAATVLVLLGLAAVAGVGTARAAETIPTKTYCLDNQTVTTSDSGLQEGLDISISDYGGVLPSAEVGFDETDPDGSSEAGESFIDQYYDSVFDGGDDFVGIGTWSQGDIEDLLDEEEVNYEDVTDVTTHHVAAGACASAAKPTQPAAREAYCSVTGNTNPFSGTPIAPGTFLDLLAGQAATDKHYTGAVPAWYVQGVGLTCSLTPAQAALAATSTLRAGAAGDLETPIPGVPDYAIYPYVPAK